MWLNPELACERKSVGSGGVEPCHPVVSGHTCLLVVKIVKNQQEMLCLFMVRAVKRSKEKPFLII